MTLNEVAPPGFGHTKGDKKKGVEKGGTAAAFDRARKEGRFKGSKSDMFAIMWSQKNKGDKPHYKPGTNKKYKKYQEESAVLDEVSKELALKAYAKRVKRIHDTEDTDDEKEIDRQTTKSGKYKDDETKRRIEKKHGKDKKTDYAMGRAIYKANLGNQVGDRNESFEIDKSAHKTAQKKAKLRNLAKGNTNPNEKAAAEKKAGGPKLMGEGKRWDSYKKAVATVLGKKKEQKKPEKAMDAGARAKRKLQRKVHATYVSGSEDNVPDEIRD